MQPPDSKRRPIIDTSLDEYRTHEYFDGSFRNVQFVGDFFIP
jgi:hypothetical protein